MSDIMLDIEYMVKSGSFKRYAMLSRIYGVPLTYWKCQRFFNLVLEMNWVHSEILGMDGPYEYWSSDKTIYDIERERNA